MILMITSVDNGCERTNTHITTPSYSLILYVDCSNAIIESKGELHYIIRSLTIYHMIQFGELQNIFIPILGLGNIIIVIHCHDSWSTIMMVIVLFYYHDSSRHQWRI